MNLSRIVGVRETRGLHNVIRARELYYPVTAKYVAYRKERSGYLLFNAGEVMRTNEFSIRLLELSNGYRSVNEIIETLEGEFESGTEEIEEEARQTLVEATKMGIILWIPLSGIHLGQNSLSSRNPHRT